MSKLNGLELNQIHHMSTLEGLKQLPEESVDLVITTPPSLNSNKYDGMVSYRDYLEFLTKVFTKVYRVLKEGRVVAINVGFIEESNKGKGRERLPFPFHFVPIMESIGFKLVEDIIWVDELFYPNDRNKAFSKSRTPMTYKPNVQHKHILVFKKPMSEGSVDVLEQYTREEKQNSKVHGEYQRTSVWNIDTFDTVSVNKGNLPFEAQTNIISYYSFREDVVLDMFMGGGISALASEAIGRAWIGFELDERNVAYTKKSVDLMRRFWSH